MDNVKKTLLLIAGMPGAGKSIFVSVARKMSIPVYSMGDVIREEAKARQIDLSDESLGKLAIELRKIYGDDIIARKISKQIALSSSRIVLVDGVRSLEEVKFFQEEFGSIKIIAIHASPMTRYRRLIKRGRKDDPKDWEDFISRDYRELNIGIGNVIALADIMIINENITKEEFYDKCMKVIKKVVGDDENNCQNNY
ncbi:MAG: flagellar hook-basal body complex protein FliE [Thermoproteales archaeon]|nr:flagellar hook-basal body complex protein FliE [Thermoproteales archaeon]